MSHSRDVIFPDCTVMGHIALDPRRTRRRPGCPFPSQAGATFREAPCHSLNESIRKRLFRRCHKALSIIAFLCCSFVAVTCHVTDPCLSCDSFPFSTDTRSFFGPCWAMKFRTRCQVSGLMLPTRIGFPDSYLDQVEKSGPFIASAKRRRLRPAAFLAARMTVPSGIGSASGSSMPGRTA